MFRPIHGSWPQAKGLNIAKSAGADSFRSHAVRYFDLKEEGALIRKAVDASLGQYPYPEIQVEGGGKYGTKEGAWIVDYIKH